MSPRFIENPEIGILAQQSQGCPRLSYVWGAIVGSVVFIIGLLLLLTLPVQTAGTIEQTGRIQGAIHLQIKQGNHLRPIQIPGFEVHAQSDTISVTRLTDEYGRFAFTELPYGAYHIHWGNLKWHSGEYPEMITISPTKRIAHLPPAVVTPTTNNFRWGLVRFADGTSPWFRDHHFGITQTVQVALQTANGQRLTEPTTTNAWGEFVILDMPPNFAKVAVQMVRSASFETKLPTTTTILSATFSTTPSITVTLNAKRPDFNLKVSAISQPRRTIENFMRRFATEEQTAIVTNLIGPLADRLDGVIRRFSVDEPGSTPEFVLRRFLPTDTLSVKIKEEPQVNLPEPQLLCPMLHWLPAVGQNQNNSCTIQEWKPPTAPAWRRINALLLDPAGAHSRAAIVVETNPQALSGPYGTATKQSDCLLVIKGGVDRSSSCGPLRYPPYTGCGHECQAKETTKYYALIDPFHKRTSLAEWWAVNGFDPATGAGGVQAAYQNYNDLGFGRNMNCIQRGADVACYVRNYGLPRMGEEKNNACLAQENDPTKALATVAMEYSRIDGQEQSEPIVKFYAFAGGEPEDERIFTVDLQYDQVSYKNIYLPNLCLNCHGGSARNGVKADLNAHFLPFDRSSFRNVEAAECGQTLGIEAPLIAEESRAQAFKELNQMVLATDPITGVADLICGWYDEDPNCDLTDTTDYAQNDKYVPVSWQNNPTPYLNLIKPYCRNCHLTSNYLNFAYEQSKFPADRIACDVNGEHGGKPIMPHTLVTFRNYWSAEGQIERAQQLEQYVSWFMRESRGVHPCAKDK